MQKALIIGFGKAGRYLHLHCLRKIQSQCEGRVLVDEIIGVVDPKMQDVVVEEGTSRLKFFTSLKEVKGFDPESTVVHICTPPDKHLEALQQVAEFGYKKILIEKPLTTSLSDLQQIITLQKNLCLRIFVVANWLSSSLTKKIKVLIDSNKFGEVRHIVAEQHKPRFSRTLNNSAHDTAFDVEIPHQVALALFLGGQLVEVVSGKVSDMQVGNAVVPRMGMAQIVLLHSLSGIASTLLSDLTAPIRKRSVEVYFDKYRLVGYYPSGADDNYSRLMIYHSDGRLVESLVLYDDPLSAFFTDYYSYFDGILDVTPCSDLNFNKSVVDVICQAKVQCGLLFNAEKRFMYA